MAQLGNPQEKLEHGDVVQLGGHYMIYDNTNDAFIHMIAKVGRASNWTRGIPIVNELASASVALVESAKDIPGQIVVSPAREIRDAKKFVVVTKFDDPILPPAEVVRKALNEVCDNTRYHLLNRNCQHFAVWCKTGRGFSPDVESRLKGYVVNTAKGVVFGILGVGGSLGIKYSGLGMAVRIGLHTAGFGLYGPVYPVVVQACAITGAAAAICFGASKLVKANANTTANFGESPNKIAD